MDSPAWSKEELERIWATNWIPKVKSAELIAEQLMNYFFPAAAHRTHMQVLMLFELLKVFFRLKAYFSSDEAVLMEEKIFAFLMADKRRKQMLFSRMENIYGLLKLHSSNSAEDKATVLERVHRVLGLKKREKKVEERSRTADDENPEQLSLQPASASPVQTEYVEDKESLVSANNEDR